MFDTGFWEFTLIAVIVLVVVGPEKMPALAKTAGKYIAKLKNFIANIKSDAGNEFDIDSIKQQLTLDDSILDIVKDTKDEIKNSATDIKKSMNTIKEDEKSTSVNK